MASNNPAFGRPEFSNRGYAGRVQDLPDVSPGTLDQMYSRPAAGSVETDRMTVEDTLAKTVGAFALLLVGAAVGWFTSESIPLLWIGAALVGLVLGLVNSFKREPSAPLILAYAAVEGVFVGGISQFFELMFPGIVVQATLATLTVIGVTLALFASGKVRASARATKVFLVAMVGYLAFSLINVVLMVTGVNDNAFGLRSEPSFIFGIPWGIIIGVFVVLLAAYSLVLDFDSIKTGVQRGAPRIFAWQAAFGIMVTVVWLYLEILRIIGIARN